MDKQKAIQIIKDAPVDWEYFATSNERFYKKAYDRWFFYSGSEWLECEKLTPLYSSRASMIPKSEILKIAEGEEMKTYPYIGKDNYGQVYLMLSDSDAITMDSDSFTHTPMQEGGYTNITREYLQNTYGEVVSPEHAEFIVELAKGAGFKVWSIKCIDEIKTFTFERGELCLLSYQHEGLDSRMLKQITIPLPPKQIQTATPEEEFEMKQIMKNAGDNLVLGCEDSKCDEWPKIGDEVLVYSNSRRNMEIRDKVVKVIGKCTHSDGGTILTVEHSSLGVFAVANGSWIQKPKTPEEELRDEIAKQLGVITDNHLSSCGSWIQSITDALLNNKISGLNITKKPQ